MADEGKTPMIYGNPNSYFKDFCPLCGSRFYGDTRDEVYKLIQEHIDSGYCVDHFRPFAEALADTGEDLRQ